MCCDCAARRARRMDPTPRADEGVCAAKATPAGVLPLRRTPNGTARCWGKDFVYLNDAFTPVPVSGLAGAVALASGHAHDCALLVDGRVVCWGRNTSGQLGDGTTTSSPTPVEVIGLP